jgi:hypothetical protein
MRKFSIVFLLSIAIGISGCFNDIGKCNEDSYEVNKAKALNTQELQAILNEVTLFYKMKESGNENLNILSTIRTLEPEHIAVTGRGRISVYLKACGFDSKIIMFVESANIQEISIMWGDYGSPKAGSMQLWPEA